MFQVRLSGSWQITSLLSCTPVKYQILKMCFDVKIICLLVDHLWLGLQVHGTRSNFLSFLCTVEVLSSFGNYDDKLFVSFRILKIRYCSLGNLQIFEQNFFLENNITVHDLETYIFMERFFPFIIKSDS